MAIGFNDLDDTVPADTAFIGEGAAKIREVKQALNTVFPNVKAEITKPTDYGSAGTQPSAADFSLLFTDVAGLNDDTANARDIPIGTIISWFGDYQTEQTNLNNNGWYLCDGNGGTPDLVDRFLKGGSGTNQGVTYTPTNARTGIAVATGTSTPKAVTKSVVLTEANIPEHNHFVANAGSVNPESDGNQLGQNVTPGAALRYGITQGSIGDAEYEFGGITGVEADVFGSSKYGNASPTGISVGADDTEFAHEHLLSVDVQPSNMALVFLMYKGRP